MNFDHPESIIENTVSYYFKEHMNFEITKHIYENDKRLLIANEIEFKTIERDGRVFLVVDQSKFDLADSIIN